MKVSIIKLSLLFFPNVRLPYFLTKFNTNYFKDYLSLLSKNLCSTVSEEKIKFLHFVHF